MPKLVVSIDLPLPPSVNHLWGFGNRRCYPKKQYKQWIVNAKACEMVQECRPPKNRNDSRKVEIAIQVFPGKGFRWNRDGSNMIKALEDWLVNNGYIKDDSFQFVRETKVFLSNQQVPESFVRVTVTQ
jgi:Holliday junction resolvase RusA-like endonuclease